MNRQELHQVQIQSQNFSKVIKISPKKGDLLLFFYKTDDQGYPLMCSQYLQQAVNAIGDQLQNHAIFLPDKIHISRIGEIKETIDELKEKIDSIVDKYAGGGIVNLQDQIKGYKE